MGMAEVTTYLAAGKAALDIFKGIRSELPKTDRSQELAEQINNAENALRLSEAELAKALGYKLCQCKFPPEIMLSIGRHPKHDSEIFECRQCKKQEPSARYFQGMDNIDEYNRSLPDSYF